MLAGAAVPDVQVWDLICDIQDLELHLFGMRILGNGHELKARELLKRKTFRLAAQLDPIPDDERRELARNLLMNPTAPTRAGLTALAQAKVAFAETVPELCAGHAVRFFASIVVPGAPKPAGTVLRKDYAYLFERFFYYMDQQPGWDRGLVIFDELEKTKAHLLVGQMSSYCRGTSLGRMRLGRIIPEPLFVHSDLTTGVQVADLAGYVISWNVRVGMMPLGYKARPELDSLGAKVLQLRHRALVERNGFPDGFSVWSFSVIDDLRPRTEQGGQPLFP